MSRLPLVYLRQYRARVTVSDDGFDSLNQIATAPNYAGPVTFFSNNIAFTGPDTGDGILPVNDSATWTMYDPPTYNDGVGDFAARFGRHYSVTGTAPNMLVTPLTNPPIGLDDELRGLNAVQFAVPGAAVPVSLGADETNYSAITVPSTFTGERWLVSINTAFYQTTTVSNNPPLFPLPSLSQRSTRAIQLVENVQVPLWNTSGSSTLTSMGVSFNDFYQDWNSALSTRYWFGLWQHMAFTRVGPGDVVDLGATDANGTTLLGHRYNAFLLAGPDGSEYEFGSTTRSYKRLAGSVEAATGSLLDSVTINAVDNSVREQVPLDTTRSDAATNMFVEAMQPDEVAAGYIALPEQSTGYVNEYVGESILSRMTRAYPPAMVGLASDLFGGLLTRYWDGAAYVVTAQDMIEAILASWAVEYPWFSYVQVPDLRLRVRSPDSGLLTPATPAEYQADATLGRIGAPGLFYLQDKDSRLTMRQMLDELLSPFPGTIVRVNAGNQLEIVPVYGPDADSTTAVVLTAKDAYNVTTGQANSTGVINQCTVRSEPYSVTNDVGVMNQAFFRLVSNIWSGNIDVPSDGSGTDITNTNAGGPRPLFGWNPQGWLMQDNVLPDGEIKLKDSSDVVQISIKWYAQDNGANGTYTPTAAQVRNIPINGSTVRAIDDVLINVGGGNPFNSNMNLRINIDARYNAETKTVQFTPAGVNNFEPTNNFGLAPNPCSVVIQLNDATNAWQRGNVTVTGTYGEGLLTEQYGDLGGALGDSVTAFGLREADINITGYAVTDPVVCEQVAVAYVAQAISPTLLRSVDQSAWRAFPVRLHHLGQLVELPSGEVGRVTRRAYDDSFGGTYGNGSITSLAEVEVADPTAPGYVNPTFEYLLMDDGSIFVLDNGVLAEEG